MKTIKNLTYILILLTVLSCEDILDEQPNDTISETTFWKTSTDAEAGLVACYDALRATRERLGFTWERWGLFDLLTQVGTCRNPQIRSASIGTMNPTLNFVESAWGAHYRGLVRTNDLLINIDAIPFENQDRKDEVIGEGRYLRAMYLFGLTMIWGDVPYFDDVPGLESVDISNTPQSEILASIKSDLQIAIDLLPENPGDPGRAGKGAAHMLRLKVALFEEDWDTAVASAEAVINLGIYQLESDFAGIFTLDNENNDEVIFDIQGIADSEIEEGNTFEDAYSGRFSSNNGLSWVNPGLWLVDKYEVIDPNPTYVQEDIRIPTEIYDYFEGRDPRMDATIIRPGAHFIGPGGTDFLYPFVPNYTHSQTGLHSRKYVVTGDGSRPGRDASPLNFIVFRYADAILHWAEAKVQQNASAAMGDQSVLDAINSIRARASDQLPLYTVGQFTNPDDLLNAIYDERIRELALEGWLYWDFKRWNLIEQRDGFGVMGIQIQSNTVIFRPNPVFTYVWMPNRDEFLPIPQSEIDINPNLEQNPGY